MENIKDKKNTSQKDPINKILGMKENEAISLKNSMKSVKHLEGDIAEAGVHKGGSAKIICEEKGDKHLHLFDTFRGMPKEHEDENAIGDSTWFHNTSTQEVEDYLKEFGNVHLHPGIFPETATIIEDKKFCLVNLDLDTYEGTRAGIKFFWPRMIKHGRIIIHDYNSKDWKGVKKAVKEFFHENPEKIIDVVDSQAMIIK